VYGIIDNHYGNLDYGHIKIKEGASDLWSNPSWFVGNSMLAYIQEGTPLDVNEEKDYMNKISEASIIRGFSFDAEPVKDQVARVVALNVEYDKMMFLPDFETKYQEWLTKLNQAGYQEIVEEAQRQLTAWAKENGKLS
jgi:putative aldouronate transport system substrate-binding protein